MEEVKKGLGFIKIEEGRVKYGEQSFNPVWLNRRLRSALKGLSREVMPLSAYFIIGDCLAPEILSGDLLIVFHNLPPANSDIVLVQRESGSFFNRYRKKGKEVWLESAHGKRGLHECIISGVALVAARAESGTQDCKLVPVPIMGTLDSKRGIILEGSMTI